MKSVAIASVFVILLATHSIAQEVKPSETNAKDLLLRWNQCHNERDANCFSALFGSTTMFYSKLLSIPDVIGLKTSLFDKHPTFSQVIDDNTISYHYFGDTLAIHFVKEVATVSGKRKYPSYLLILNDGESEKIVAESDDITDKKLSVPRNWSVESAAIVPDSIATTSNILESKSDEPKAENRSAQSNNSQTQSEEVKPHNPRDVDIKLEFTWKFFFICTIPFFLTLALFLRKTIGIKPNVESEQEEPSLSIGEKFIWGSALFGGFLILLGGIFVPLSIILLPVGIICYTVLFHGYAHKCKECSVWWAGKSIGDDILERWQEMKNITRNDVTKDRNGRVLATTQRQEQIIVDCQKIRHNFQCKKCGTRWATIETKKSDTMLNSIARRFGG